MAMQLGNSEEFKSEINVTPLVDIVLVLLIIFMVVTPLLKQEVPLADNSHGVTDASQLTLTISADGLLLLNGENLLAETLVTQLQAIYANRADKTIFLEADRSLPYGRVVDVMDDCRAAGVVTIGVITKKEKPRAS
jgi:biopolymer transport protein ExbD